MLLNFDAAKLSRKMLLLYNKFYNKVGEREKKNIKYD